MSFADEFPVVAAEWHPTRNGGLTPGDVSSGSKKVVWWVGSCGHEWQMSVGYRKKGFGCPVCVSFGFLFPALAEQWHPTRNEKSPFEFRANSGVKVWWLGECGHEWEMVIRNRVRDGQGCPVCVNQKIVAGVNDLATTHPEIAKEWHPTRNEGLTPAMVSYGSKRKVWWFRESCEHEWEAVVVSRATKNVGCAVCRGFQVNKGVNDLAYKNPQLASQWHPTRNGDLTPEEVSYGSSQKVWWQCSSGHEWEAKIIERADGYDCIVCSNHVIIPGLNNFGILYPTVANEWDYDKNENVSPEGFSYGSNFKAYWKCSMGHSWLAKIADRCVKSSGCPQCAAGLQRSKAEHELAEFLSGLGLTVETNVRNVIQGELDIYVPGKKVAVEFNGLYWHTETFGKTRFYHYDKWKACKEVGVQLVQVWEDDYARNPELVKRMLAHKLGVSNSVRVYARETVIREVSQDEVHRFLNDFHVQGGVDGGIRVGLFEKITGKSFQEKLVAVMVLKREPGTNGTILNLLRYATAVNVVGGFSKLLKHVVRTYTPEKIVTFSDNTVSDGGLYANNGFVVVKELKPDYMYVVKGERVHKFNYRLKRFRDDENLRFVEGLTESELAKLNGLPRVWDAGKTKWEFVV